MSDIPDIIEDALKRDIMAVYPELADIIGLSECLKRYVELSGRKIVFVIDEWDALIREASNDNEIQEIVGINYDDKTKSHRCEIEHIKKQ